MSSGNFVAPAPRSIPTRCKQPRAAGIEQAPVSRVVRPLPGNARRRGRSLAGAGRAALLAARASPRGKLGRCVDRCAVRARQALGLHCRVNCWPRRLWQRDRAGHLPPIAVTSWVDTARLRARVAAMQADPAMLAGQVLTAAASDGERESGPRLRRFRSASGAQLPSRADRVGACPPPPSPPRSLCSFRRRHPGA